MNKEEAIKQLEIILQNIIEERKQGIASIEGIKFQEALQTALNLIQKQDKIIDLMARAIDNYNSQLVINTFKDKEEFIKLFKKEVEKMNKDEQTVEEIMNLLKFASMEEKENVSLKLDGLACKTIYKYIKSLRSTIENLSLDTDRWFKSSVNKQKQYVELERKTDEIIENFKKEIE